MFTVEWLVDGVPVQEAAMLGNTVADVMIIARARTPQISAAGGNSPDTIRVVDHLRNETTVERIAADAQGS
jgi:hypothetical protein